MSWVPEFILAAIMLSTFLTALSKSKDLQTTILCQIGITLTYYGYMILNELKDASDRRRE